MNAPQSTQVEPIHGDDESPPAPQQAPSQPSGKTNGKPAAHAPAHGGAETEIPKDLPKPKTGTVILVAAIMCGCLIALFIVGWLPERNAAKQANSDAAEAAGGEPAVTVVHPKVEEVSKDVILPCDIRANQQAALYARATGFLKQWNFDIGSKVKKGQLLAVISAPDVDAQLVETKAALEQAKATVVKAQADVDVANTDYQRYLKSQAQSPGSVTPQDVDAKRGAYDDAVGALKVAMATVDQDNASVQQLAVQQGFEEVTAPFSGTITARNYDVGALITASNTSTGKELFDIADIDTLRVFVNVPQTYATNIRIGQPGFLTVRNYGDRQFQGTVTRTAGALDQTTRTIPFEIDFDNSDGALYAGMYGQARLPTSEPTPPLTIPSSAMIFNAQGTQVAVVRDGVVHLQKVMIGRDLGTELEITSGVSKDDQVISNPGERISEGVKVKINTPVTQPSAAGAK
jgi:RND family efflux transporter MFP subunit